MCWMCDRYARTNLSVRADEPGLTVHLNRAAAMRSVEAMWVTGPSFEPLFQYGPGKYTTALPVDGVGDLKPPFTIGLIVTPDEAGGGKDVPPGNPVLTVGAPSIIATVNTIGDEDFFQVTLTAGTTYEIGQYSYFAGPNGVNLTDPYIELYAADGTTMIVSADGGANTPYNDVNSGFDVLLTYTPDVTGTYYVNARAFSNSPATDNGDSVGDYELFVRVQDPNDPNIYHPYYEPDEPLYAIDWGTQVNKINQSARNPDGNDGTRNTGNADGTPVYTSLLDIPALAAAQGKDITNKNVITIYFAQEGDVFVSNDPTNPGLPPATITAVAIQDFEYTAVWTSLAEFEKVADIVYLEVDDQDHADFIYTSYQGTPGPGVSLLGSMSPPDESDEGLAQFNSGDERWNARDLAQGGFSFVTLIHEFGHGHGLAHPHDNGGHSGIMNGVEEESPFNYTTGDFELNQGVFTMMSYEDGWQSSPYGNASTTAGYGWLGGLMAFDIAAIQDKYGVNEDYNTGNNTYTMKDVNAAGTYYTSIWDAAGIDQIVYTGARNATIDLRPASLLYEYGGGGWVSFAFGIFGGFTIANGVTIENATSGSGNDTLIGNAVANILDGGAGIDAMTGGAGNDLYAVDNAADQIIEAAGPGQGFDQVYATAGYGLAAGVSVEVLSAASWASTNALNLTGNEFGQQIFGNAGANALSGGGGADALYGFGGDDLYVVDGDDVIFEASGGGFDQAYTASGHTLAAGAAVEVLSAASSSSTNAINLTGNALGQQIFGNAGANILAGGGGTDSLYGLGGNDTYLVEQDDFVFEGAGQGFDQVYVPGDYVLADGVEAEVLAVGNASSLGSIHLTGNAFGQTIFGNDGANVIDGGGGADALHGRGGDDLYSVQSDDLVYEGAGQGFDQVYSSGSFTLAAGAEVEVIAAGNSASTTALSLAGNAFGQQVFGNAGANVIDGGGGADALYGFGGADMFAFTTALGGGNVDAIADFNAADDTIGLDDAVFTGLGLGVLSASAFVVGAAAGDADDRIIYNQATGQLLFDADGNGAGAAVQFATLDGAPVITAGDFHVI